MKKIKLQAISPEKNLARSYEISLQKGLFKVWIVHTAYGRIGSKNAQTKNYFFEEKIEAQKTIEKILKKRLNSQKRIGVNYAIVT